MEPRFIVSTLTDKEIINLVKQGRLIKKDTFKEANCNGVYYDLRVGHKAKMLKSQKEVEISEKEPLQILPLECVNIRTEEEIVKDNIHFGRIYSKTGLVSQGISHISTTIDPGFNGPLWITVCNHGYKTVKLNRGQVLCKLEFSRLIQSPEKIYGRDYGHHQDALERPPVTETVEEWDPTPLDNINQQLLDKIRSSRPPFDVVIGKIFQLEEKIKLFEGISEDRKHTRTIILTVIGAFIAAIVGGVIPLIIPQYLKLAIIITIVWAIGSIIGVKLLKI